MTRAGDWQERASCRDLSLEDSDEMFFTESRSNASAVVLCRSCGVLDECLGYVRRLERAVGTMPGIYAGLTQQQRRATRRGVEMT